MLQKINVVRVKGIAGTCESVSRVRRGIKLPEHENDNKRTEIACRNRYYESLNFP